MGLLKTLFGEDVNDVWREFAKQVGADFVSGGLWKQSKVVAKAGNWPIVLDLLPAGEGVMITRVRSAFKNKQAFRFRIYRRSWFSGLWKLLGGRTVEVGIPAIDKEFIVRGNDDAKIRSLFTNPIITKAVEQWPKGGDFQIKDKEGFLGTKFPDDADEMYFQAVRVVKNLEELSTIFTFFAEMLNQLCRIGVATEDDPGVAF